MRKKLITRTNHFLKFSACVILTSQINWKRLHFNPHLDLCDQLHHPRTEKQQCDEQAQSKLRVLPPILVKINDGGMIDSFSQKSVLWRVRERKKLLRWDNNMQYFLLKYCGSHPILATDKNVSWLRVIQLKKNYFVKNQKTRIPAAWSNPYRTCQIHGERQ